MAAQVSLKTIAEKCHLSVPTVSQILNARPNNYSSKETKERVFRIARELGYQTNFGYQLLHGQTTGTFAILLAQPHMQYEEYIRDLILNLMNELNIRQYNTYFSPMTFDAVKNLKSIRELLRRGVEYFIFLGSPVGVSQIEQLIEKSSCSCISTSPDFSRHCVIDTPSGILEIYKYFFRQVGDQFRVITTPFLSSDRFDNRLDALAKLYAGKYSSEEIRKKFQRVTPHPQIPGNRYNETIFENAETVMEQILTEEPDVKAVFCHIDTAALGAGNCLIKHGLKIGQDMLLAGVNDDFIIRKSALPISSVNHDWDKYYLKLIDGVLASADCQLLLPPSVHIRELNSQ